jgi:hypothetical protein
VRPDFRLPGGGGRLLKWGSVMNLNFYSGCNGKNKQKKNVTIRWTFCRAVPPARLGAAVAGLTAVAVVTVVAAQRARSWFRGFSVVTVGGSRRLVEVGLPGCVGRGSPPTSAPWSRTGSRRALQELCTRRGSARGRRISSTATRGTEVGVLAGRAHCLLPLVPLRPVVVFLRGWFGCGWSKCGCSGRCGGLGGERPGWQPDYLSRRGPRPARPRLPTRGPGFGPWRCRWGPAGVKVVPRWAPVSPTPLRVVGLSASSGGSGVAGSLLPLGGSVAPGGTAPGADGRPVALPERGRLDWSVAVGVVAERSASLSAPVRLVDSASCKCWQGQLRVRVLCMASGRLLVL